MSTFVNSERIIKAWVNKGDLESDDFSKFICYWVAFNCWLYTSTNEVRDREALSILYQKQHLYKNFPQLVVANKLVFEQFLSIGTIINNRIPDRQTFVRNATEFNEVVDMLYEIRCNLFHGSKLDTDTRDREVVEASTPILGLIVKGICLKSINKI